MFYVKLVISYQVIAEFSQKMMFFGLSLIYIDISTFKFVCSYCVVMFFRPVTLPIPVVVLQNVTNNICLVCHESDKYAFLVILTSLGSMRQGEAEPPTLK